LSAGVVLTGPLSPADIADLLTGEDRSRAQSIKGYRGIPTSELARALLAAGVEVEVVTGAPEVDSPVELEGPGLRVLVAPRRTRARDLALTLFRDERRALEALLAATESDIIHAHWTYEFAWAALNTGPPVLVTAHDAPLSVLLQMRDSYRALRALMACIVRTRTDHLTAVSPYLAARWRREMFYRRPIAVIPNIAPSLFVQPGSPVIANGAALVDVTDAGRVKNVIALIEAFGYLRDEGRDIVLNLVGPGLGRQDPLAAKMRALGFAEGVIFHGILSRDSLAGVLASSTVFVHPSREESCGLSLLEAMNTGLPVVGGIRSGGVPWVLDGGRAGVLVDVERPSEIAAAVRNLLDDEARAQELVTRGREHTARYFTAGAVAAAYLDAYEGLRLATRRRRLQ
jgi:glycosyltransferase involved in cell wall biosynthesis